MIRLNLLKGLGPVLQFAEGESVELPDNVEQAVIRRTDPTWPKTFFVPRLTGSGRLFQCLLRHGKLGQQSLHFMLWSHWRTAYDAGLYAAYSCMHA